MNLAIIMESTTAQLIQVTITAYCLVLKKILIVHCGGFNQSLVVASVECCWCH